MLHWNLQKDTKMQVKVNL